MASLPQPIVLCVNTLFLIPFFVGICSVLQGGLNRRIANSEWGLTWAIMLNSLIVLVLVAILMLWGYFPGKFTLSSLKWWHFLPGLFGFAVILLIPISISKLGALNSFLILISSQILVSGLWDRWVEGVEVSWTRLAGASLAIMGAWLATK